MRKLNSIGLDVVVSGLKYVIAAPLVVICGTNDWLDNGDRTGYVFNMKREVNEDTIDDIFVRRGLFSKIGDYYISLVR